ncbi:hypothetical protein QWY77_03285 [Thalassotalea ponticola]|uniref:hypothetical protein n=1 Tax=Thalassotalea ponticola TaxID=1523392 RepID=UPI0025B34899|nr:hypothetical protein [Thalassotalea ponticola]MDN3651789.1 hypothetical protein [Thalassotalea ponticola]
MRKLLTLPAKLNTCPVEDAIYQNALTCITDLALNLMAVKVNDYPEDFLGWCQKLLHVCEKEINFDLLDDKQLPVLKKLEECLSQGISQVQLKMLRVAPWPIFYQAIDAMAERQSLAERKRLLEYINTIRQLPLSELSLVDLQTIAGKHSANHDIDNYPFDVEWFGSTKAAKTFHRLLVNHTELFEQALSHIPLQGEVEKTHYSQFVTDYKAIFALHGDGDKAPLMPATRLLAMRRPDVFVPITNGKLSAFCKGLNITKFSNQDFDAYYTELIQVLPVLAWYRCDMPEDDEQAFIWQHRALMFDLFFYADEGQAARSNYVRMRDKPKAVKVSAGINKAGKRSKETAAMIVDKALAEDGVEDFLHDLRDTLIKSVSNGKSVEQAMQLMRSIFG